MWPGRGEELPNFPWLFHRLLDKFVEVEGPTNLAELVGRHCDRIKGQLDQLISSDVSIAARSRDRDVGVCDGRCSWESDG